MDLAEIGKEVHLKPIETGLLQEHLARMAGLSRVTINQLENGTIKDLGYAKLKVVMDLLGMNIATLESRGIKNAIRACKLDCVNT